MHDARDNFTAIGALDALANADDPGQLKVLQDWTEREFLLIRDRVLNRGGLWVKECHGDLHLANLALLDGELVPFDCLEFNAELRWIDVMNEVAFLMMDLLDRGADALAWLFLNAYLEASGDYPGVAVLRFYLVYRAMVRAKVHLLRASQSAEERERQRLRGEYRAYVKLATRCTRIGRSGIVLMHGYSGCGKTVLAREFVWAAGGLIVRSDVERRRLHGLRPRQSSGSTIGGGIYTHSASDAVYAHLCVCASQIARAGYTAIVDATFLARSERARFRDAAHALGVPVAVVDVQAPVDVLNARIVARLTLADDASEATAQVLQTQIATSDPLTLDENIRVVPVDGCRPLALLTTAELLGYLATSHRSRQRAAAGA